MAKTKRSAGRRQQSHVLNASSLTAASPVLGAPSATSMSERYMPAERDAIIKTAPRPLTDADWGEFERLAAVYCERMPTFTRARTHSIKRISQRLVRELTGAKNGCYWSPEIARQVKVLRDVEAFARAHTDRRTGNRAQPTLDGYIAGVALFYRDRLGGHLGKATNAPCARFVTAVVAPVVAAGAGGKLKSIAHVIRSRLWLRIMPVLATSSPALGHPEININPGAGGCD